MNDILPKILSLAESSSLDDSYYYNLIHERVAYLLTHEINQLFQLLYRIDLKEEDVKSVFTKYEEKQHISEHITLLIIKRLKEKIELRNKYSSKS